MWRPGERVRVVGLVEAVELNDRIGSFVLQEAGERGRVLIGLDTGEEIKLRPNNVARLDEGQESIPAAATGTDRIHVAPPPVLTSRVLESPKGEPTPLPAAATPRQGTLLPSFPVSTSSTPGGSTRKGPKVIAAVPLSSYMTHAGGGRLHDEPTSALLTDRSEASSAGARGAWGPATAAAANSTTTAASGGTRMFDAPATSLLTDRSIAPEASRSSMDMAASGGVWSRMQDEPANSLLTERTMPPSISLPTGRSMPASSRTGIPADRSIDNTASSTHHVGPPASMAMMMAKKRAAGLMLLSPKSVAFPLPPSVVGEQSVERLYPVFGAPSIIGSLGHVWSSELGGIHAIVRRIKRGGEMADSLMRGDSQGEMTILESFAPEGQLWRKGVTPGMELVTVDGKNVEGMTLRRLQQYIEGEEGTPVVLEVMAGAEEDREEGRERRRVTVIRSRSPIVDASITAYEEVLAMLGGEVNPLVGSSDVVYQMHKRVAGLVRSCLDGRREANEALARLSSMPKQAAPCAGDDEIRDLQNLIAELSQQREAEREELVKAAREERERLKREMASLERMMREMADEFDQSVAGYVEMEKQTLAHISLKLDIDFEGARDNNAKFQSQLRSEVSHALQASIERIDVVSIHRGSTIAIIEILPPVEGMSGASPHSLAAELISQVGDKGSIFKSGGIGRRAMSAALVKATEVAKGQGAFREMLSAVSAENEALKRELEAAEVVMKAHEAKIESLKHMEHEWQRAEERLGQALGRIGKDELALHDAEKTCASLGADLVKARESAQAERIKEAAAREQLVVSMREVEDDAAAANELAASRQKTISNLQRQLVMEGGESEGLRGRLEEIKTLHSELDSVQEREAKVKSEVSTLQMQVEALEKELGQTRGELEKANEECCRVKAVDLGIVRHEQLALAHETHTMQMRDLSRSLSEVEGKYVQTLIAVQKVSAELLDDHEGGESKMLLKNAVRAEQARSDLLRLELSRKERELAEERKKQEAYAGLSQVPDADVLSQVLEDRNSTIESLEQQVKKLNTTVESLEAEIGGIETEETLILLRKLRQLLEDYATHGAPRYAPAHFDEEGSPVQKIMLQAQAKEIVRLQGRLIALSKALQPASA